MLETLAILLMATAGTLGAACAINFFWQTGFRRAAGYAGFFVCIFLVFWASGLWEGASRHSWGVLTPVLALMIVGGWLGVKYAPKLLRAIRQRLEEKK